MFNYDYERMEYNQYSDFYPEDERLTASQTQELHGVVEDLIDNFYGKDRDLKEISYFVQRLAEITSVYVNPKLLEEFEV